MEETVLNEWREPIVKKVCIIFTNSPLLCSFKSPFGPC